MKFTLSTAVLALSLASVQAAPVVEKVTEAATVESRTLGLLSSLFGGSNCWWTGTSRTYKMRASWYMTTPSRNGPYPVQTANLQQP